MLILIVNSGSSSIKFEVIDLGEDGCDRSILAGEVERIGGPDASLRLLVSPTSPQGPRRVRAADHLEAMDAAIEAIESSGIGNGLTDIAAVGHRVVHGGALFTEPVVIGDDVRSGIEKIAELAPLHAHANLAGIDAAMARFDDIPHVAVFDTTFHNTLPPRAREYALPREITQAHGIRRYGFHGISHAYVSRRAASFLRRPVESLDLITLHLGNGASATAIRKGVSIDTSMGMTPLEGLVMGTRCGDVDPAVPMLLGEITGRSREDVHRLMNHESGLLGLCGASDMRDVHRLADLGDKDARAALEMYCYRAKKYIGAYFAALGRLDAIVFTGGVGENDPDVRATICEGLENLGIRVDPDRNAEPGTSERAVSAADAAVAVLVIPTDEECEIARSTRECLRQLGHTTPKE